LQDVRKKHKTKRTLMGEGKRESLENKKKPGGGSVVVAVGKKIRKAWSLENNREREKRKKTRRRGSCKCWVKISWSEGGDFGEGPAQGKNATRKPVRGLNHLPWGGKGPIRNT